MKHLKTFLIIFACSVILLIILFFFFSKSFGGFNKLMGNVADCNRERKLIGLGGRYYRNEDGTKLCYKEDGENGKANYRLVANNINFDSSQFVYINENQIKYGDKIYCYQEVCLADVKTNDIESTDYGLRIDNDYFKKDPSGGSSSRLVKDEEKSSGAKPDKDSKKVVFNISQDETGDSLVLVDNTSDTPVKRTVYKFDPSSPVGFDDPPLILKYSEYIVIPTLDAGITDIMIFTPDGTLLVESVRNINSEFDSWSIAPYNSADGPIKKGEVLAISLYKSDYLGGYAEINLQTGELIPDSMEVN